MNLETAKKTFHAALRPDGLRSISEGIIAPGNDFSMTRIQECFLVAAARIEELQSEVKSHSCNYKIGHPLVTSPCPLCLLEKEFSD